MTVNDWGGGRGEGGAWRHIVPSVQGKRLGFVVESVIAQNLCVINLKGKLRMAADNAICLNFIQERCEQYCALRGEVLQWL